MTYEMFTDTVVAPDKTLRQITFGTDIDVPYDNKGRKEKVEIKEKLEFLAKYLPTAKCVHLEVIGDLKQKDAFRIRIKGQAIRFEV